MDGADWDTGVACRCGRRCWFRFRLLRWVFRSVATPDGAFAQSSAAPATEPPSQQLPAVNVPRPEQKQKAAVKKAAAKKAAPRVQTQAPRTTSIVLPDIVNIAAATRQTDPDNSASEMTFSGQRVVEQPYARPGEFLEIDARPDRHPAFRRRQSQPVLPARLQSRPRHRPRHLGRRHAGQHAHPRPRPGLRRHQPS